MNRPATDAMEDTIRRRVASLNNLHEGQSHLADVVALGARALPCLEKLLRGRTDPVPLPRLLAADAIAAIGGREAANALLRALQDSISRELSPTLQEAETTIVDRVAEHLGNTWHPRMTDVLLSALQRRNYPGCVAALGKLREERAIPLLAACLADDYAREAAVRALHRFGQAAIPALTKTLDAANGATSQDAAIEIGRAAAARLLGKIGGRFVHQPLLRALRDPNRHVRLAAALSLAPIIGPDRDRAIATLIELLDNENWHQIDIIENCLQSTGIAAMRALACAIAKPAAGVEGARRRARASQLLHRMRTSRS